MKQNLDTLRSDIEHYLEAEGFVVFHGFSRLSEMGPLVEWDTERYPDYRLFLRTAQEAGVKMIVYHYGTFSGEPLDESEDLRPTRLGIHNRSHCYLVRLRVDVTERSVA